MDRVSRGVGSPCPLLLIGFPLAIIRFDSRSPLEAAATEPEEALQKPLGLTGELIQD